MARYTLYQGYQGAQPPPPPRHPKPQTPPDPRIVTVRDGIPLQFAGCEGAAIRVLHPTNPRAPSRNFGLTMLYMPPHAVLPNSAHEPEECYAILEGEGTMVFHDTTRPVKKGDFVHLPPWCVHGIENTGTQMLVVLVATSPTNP